MKRVVGLLAGLVCLANSLAAEPVLVLRPEPVRDAWWQRAVLNPRSTVVQGVPVKRMHPDWCAAEAFSRELFGDELLAGLPAHRHFSLDGAFDAGLESKGRAQIAFVGAYRRCGGEQGLFVAIVEPHLQRPRVRFLVEVPQAPSAVAALSREPDGALAVWWCLDCDEGHRIAFNRDSKGFFVAGPATRR